MAEIEPSWVAEWLDIARENTPTWYYYAGGEAPTSFRDFWGDVIVRCFGRYYQASMFCGYVRHEIIYGNNVGHMIRHYTPENQNQDVINLIQQIWEMDQQRGNKPVPSNFICAIKPDQKAKPDSEQDLEIGRHAQQCFAGNGNFYLRASLNLNGVGFHTRNITRVINGTEMTDDTVGRFYSDAIYHDWTCAEKRKIRGEKALGEIKSCLDQGDRKICIFGGLETGIDTCYDIKAYLRNDVKKGHIKVQEPYFRYHCSWRGTLFIRNGIAILSNYYWPCSDFDLLGNICYPVYGIPDDEFTRLHNQIQMMYHKQPVKS